MDTSEIQTAAPVLAKFMEQEHSTEINHLDSDIGAANNSQGDCSASSDSDEGSYEFFKKRIAKIEQLLHDIGMEDFSVECIQHGDCFLNGVYELESTKNSNEQYILRVPVLPDFRKSDGACEAIENDAVILDYLADKLPVPRVKTYSVHKNNAMNKPYTIQTKLSGTSLDNVWDELSVADKMAITDQFVELLAKIQSIEFPTAGTFAANPSLPPSTSDSTIGATPSIEIFHEDVEEDIDDPSMQELKHDRAGSDLKALLTSHIKGWMAQESKVEQSFAISSLHFLLEMIDELDQECAFKNAPFPIVLHHWDLEARNIMVEKINDEWKICGVIDWDGALALPRPLARRPHDWIWDYDCEGFTGYFDNDHHPGVNLSEEQLALKTHFDAKAAAALDGYLEDAYGHGRWLRRIWLFARNGLGSMWYLDLAKELERDWKARPKREMFPAAESKVCFERVLHWVVTLESEMRRCL